MYQPGIFIPGFLFGITKQKRYLVIPDYKFWFEITGRRFHGGFFNVDNFYLEGNENVTIFDLSKTVKYEQRNFNFWKI